MYRNLEAIRSLGKAKDPPYLLMKTGKMGIVEFVKGRLDKRLLEGESFNVTSCSHLTGKPQKVTFFMFVHKHLNCI